MGGRTTTRAASNLAFGPGILQVESEDSPEELAEPGAPSQREQLFRFDCRGRFFLLIFILLPGRIGVEGLYGFRNLFGIGSEILAEYHSILTNDERHHAGGLVFGRESDKREATGHFPINDITLGTAWRVRSLLGQHTVHI